MPASLPRLPEINIPSGSRLFALYGEARAALARMDWIANSSPNPDQLTMALIYKEALQSSLIEGIRSSASLVMSHRALRRSFQSIKSRQAEDDVSNCIDAIEFLHGKTRRGREIRLESLMESHNLLMRGESNQQKSPGKLRTIQNWIGSYRNINYIPPPPKVVSSLMADLVKFTNYNANGMDPLLRAGLAHLQFEAIHPFVDGNGRIGRILIYVVLGRFGILSRPLLYLSGYLYRNRNKYYQLLDQAREDCDWEAWLEYYLAGVIESDHTVQGVARRLDSLIRSDKRKVAVETPNVSRIYDAILVEGAVSIKVLTQTTGLSPTSIGRSLEKLQTLGIVKELTAQRRNRLYVYNRLVEIIESKFR